jgi:type I restriction-modification system
MSKYERYRDTGLTWINKVPEKWNLKKINALFDERREKVSDTDYEALSVTKNGIFKQLDNVAKTNDGDNRKKVQRNDFVINSRSDRKGSSGLSDFNGSVSLINIVLRIKKEYPRYMHYLLKSVPFQEEFYRNGKGIVADLWSTNFQSMKSIILPIPPIKEQVQIANYLDWKINEIDRLIQIEKEKIKQLDYKKQVSISIEYKKINEQRRLKMLLLEPLLYGINGVGKEKGKIRFIRITDIDSCGKLKNEKKLYIDDCEDKFLLKCGDILFARSGATVGKSYMHVNNNGLMSFAGYLIRARLDNKLVIPKFVYLYLQSEYYELWKKSVFIQSTIQNISAEKYSNLLIPIADKETQHKTIQIVNKIINSVENYKTIVFKKITELELLKQSLISEVVTGQIDVRDIAIPEYEKVAIADEEIEETDEMEGKEYGN